VCKFYAIGYCKNGWSCTFVHQTLRNIEHEDKSDLVDDAIEKEPCIYFAKGRCLKGDRCNFSHKGMHSEQKEYDQVKF